MTKLEMVQVMVKNGYELFDETPEQFANRFPEKLIWLFYEYFKACVGENWKEM